MAPSQITNENYMELVDGQGNAMAAIELPGARTPRVGECITLPAAGDPTGVRYEVERVTYYYGKRWGAEVPLSLLKVTIMVRRGDGAV